MSIDVPRGLVFNRLVHTKGLKAEFGFESRRGKLQVSSMFACNYILHADYHGVSSFSVSYVPIKIKISHIVILHYHVETLSALPNLTV